ncbi:hypothetical protein [Microcoleus sp. FACHB-1515]
MGGFWKEQNHASVSDRNRSA